MELKWQEVNGFEKVEFLYKHYVQILIMRKEANTIYGVLGIKVWLFKSEILSRVKIFY
jgi:ribosomal protein S3